MAPTDLFFPENGKEILVGTASYGSLPTTFSSSVHTLVFIIRGFKDLPQKPGKRIETEAIHACGVDWNLWVYPRGNIDSKKDSYHVSLFLHCFATDKINVWYQITLKSKTKEGKMCFDKKGFSENSYGWRDFLEREKVLTKCLDEQGSLKVTIRLRNEKSPVWYPTPPKVCHKMGELMESSMDADVTFLVGKDQQEFPTHKCILRRWAPMLFELTDCSEKSQIEIRDVSPCVFKVLLIYIYMSSLPDINEDEAFARELLLAANAFGLTLLKLHVESEIIAKFLDASNAAEWLVLADGHTCPLMEEACVQAYVDNPREVRASSGWPMVAEAPSLLDKLLSAATCIKSDETCNEVNHMSVRDLREALDSMGLCLDGNKEMLIARLTTAKSSTALQSLLGS